MDRTVHALTAFRIRTVRIGVWATLAVLVALLPYVLIAGEDDIKVGPALVLLGLGGAGALVAGALPWARLFDRGLGLPFLYAWSVLDITLITLLISVTGESHMEVFFLYAFTCIFATSYPIRAQVLLVAFTIAAYLSLLGVTGWPIETPDVVARLGLLCVFAFMGMFLSRQLINGLTAEEDERAESERRADLLAAVGQAARRVATLETKVVPQAVVDSTAALGYDAASLAIYDDEEKTYRLGYAHGLPKEYVDSVHPTSVGMSGIVLSERRTVTLDEYGEHPKAIPVLANLGYRSVVGTPVWVQGRLAAALVVGRLGDERITAQDVEAIELMALLAGRAFENARRFEDERRTVERLGELDQLKSDFLSNVSHELRTPLTAIEGIGLTLERQWNALADPLRRELMNRLNANARTLHQIITTLLDFSKIEAGRMDVHLEAVSLRSQVDAVVGRLQGLLIAHLVTVDVPEDVLVLADPVLLDRVIENLLSNAVKYTPEGTSVDISARVEASELVVSVSDTGPGIPEDDLRYLGDRFYRGGDPNTRRAGGTGLGLALVKEILSLHQTRLEVDSRVGRGSTFRFRLQVVLPDTDVPARPPEAPASTTLL